MAGKPLAGLAAAGGKGTPGVREAVVAEEDPDDFMPPKSAASSGEDPELPGAETVEAGSPGDDPAGGGPVAADGRRASGWFTPPPMPAIRGYDAVRAVKRGGQGIVYLAVQRSTKRKVAIKVLLAGRYASKAARRRFEREIELVASLKHPNVVSIFDSGRTEEGHEYYVMDYVRGVPITQYVREKKLTLEESLGLFAVVCEAVNHAHQRGVIHRDLKPSNVLVDAEGNPRVLDFGLAKSLTEPVGSLVSVTGEIAGTLPYMSPEQTRGNPDEIDTRTDVYSLGVILYEILTGKHPYPISRELAEMIRCISETPPGSPAKCWSSDSGVRTGSGRRVGLSRTGRCPLNSEVENIVLKALAKERDRRYDSAGQFARDVRRYLAGEQIIARRASAWYQLRVFSRRNKALVGGALSVLVVLVAGIATTTWQRNEAQKARVQAEEAKGRAEEQRTRANQNAEAIGSSMAFGGDYLADRNDLMGARRLYIEPLDQIRRYNQSGSPILGGLVEISSRESDGGGIPLLGRFDDDAGVGGFRGHTKHPTSVAVLPGKHMALTSGADGQLILWDLVTGRPLKSVKVTEESKGLAYVCVSRDGKLAAAAGNDGKVRLWDLDPRDPYPLRDTHIVLDHPFKDVWMVAISTDGERILTGTADGDITLWEKKDGWKEGKVIRIPGASEHKESAAALAFVPDDSRFALCGGGALSPEDMGGMFLLDLDTHEKVWEAPRGERHDGHLNCIAFSEDGKYVATGGFDKYATVWDVRGRGAGMTLQRKYPFQLQYPADVWRVAFSPDGTMLAAASKKGHVEVHDVQTGMRLRLFTYIAQKGEAMGVAFVDAQTLVSTGNDATDADRGLLLSALRIWDLRDRAVLVDAAENSPATAIRVGNEGDVEILTRAGKVVHAHIGVDSRLHEGPLPPGGSARPAVPDAYKGAVKMPTWSEAGRGGAPPSRGRPASTAGGAGDTRVLKMLQGGNARLVAGADGKLELWSTSASGVATATAEATGFASVRTFGGHKGRVVAADVSHDGRYIVSIDDKGYCLVWDLLRPALCRQFEQQMANSNLAKGARPGQQELSTLRDWYTFWGREDLAGEVEKEIPHVASR